MNKNGNRRIIYIRRTLEIIAALSAISSVVALFWGDLMSVTVLLSILLLSSIGLIIYGVIFLRRYVSIQNPLEYSMQSSFFKYESPQSKTPITFEAFRTIQCKKVCMSEFRYNFKWSGSKKPLITSDIQIVEEQVSKNKTEYDYVNFRFHRPLLYNEIATVHFKAEIDDLDNSSKPYIESRVESPISVIHYRVLLNHKDDSYSTPAIIKRRKLGCEISSAAYENIEIVQFKSANKSYEYHLISPDVGYTYRIEWEK